MGCTSSTLADVRTELEAAQAKVKEFEARGGGPPPSELEQACAKLSPAGAAKILEQVQAELQREAALQPQPATPVAPTRLVSTEPSVPTPAPKGAQDRGWAAIGPIGYRSIVHCTAYRAPGARRPTVH